MTSDAYQWTGEEVECHSGCVAAVDMTYDIMHAWSTSCIISEKGGGRVGGTSMWWEWRGGRREEGESERVKEEER